MDRNRYIELLDRFMRDGLPAEEEKELWTWFKRPEAREYLFRYYHQFWTEMKDKTLSPDVQNQMFRKIQRRIHPDGRKEEEQKVIRRISFRQGMFYAAAVVLLMILVTFVYQYKDKSDVVTDYSLQIYKVLVDKGQRASVVLPDGTRVWLNSHTELTYNGDYGKKNREVILSGEGYFEVAKDSISPFIVKAGEMEIEALGTAFNVRAYSEDKESTATLFEGKVRTSVGKNEVLLRPHESVRVNKASREMDISPEFTDYARMWKDNELVFRGETMEEVAVMLDRLYNVKVQFASERVRHYRFSGVIKNNSLENVIELISLTAPIVYKKVAGNIIIDERK